AYRLQGDPVAGPVDNAGRDQSIADGGAVSLLGDGTPAAGHTLTAFEWDLDYDGETFTVNSTNQTATFSAGTQDGPTTRTVALRVQDDVRQWSEISTAVIHIANAPPT